MTHFPAVSGFCLTTLFLTFSLGAQAPGSMSSQTPRYQSPINGPAPQLKANLPSPAAITPNGEVVEDVVVRVNDQIINRSDVERSQQQLSQELQQSNASAAEAADRQKNMLRDMIDQQLLLSRAKELGLNADAEVIRRLDDIRKQNKLDTMEDLEKAARQQGVSFEDFKANIKNGILTQQVVRDEVGRRLQGTQAQEQAYYEAHKQQFEQPEQVRLSEILIPTAADANDAAVAQAQAKADEVAGKLKSGTKFDEAAKAYSGGPTAAQGGDLGEFKRGALAKVLEDQTFSLKPGEATAPIRTRQGFVILKVTEHAAAGTPPLKQVEPQVQEAMYLEQMQPALRTYLTKLREDAYIDIKPGFVDAGASSKQTKPIFTAYAPPVVKKKRVVQKQRFDRGGRFSTASRTPGSAATAAPASAAPAANAIAATGAVTSTPASAGTASGVVTPGASVSGQAGSGQALSGQALSGQTVASNTAADRTNPRIAPVVQSGGPMAKITKNKKVKREKIRFGQAPRNTLGAGPDVAGMAQDDGLGSNHELHTTVTEAAPGTAIAPLDTSTSNVADVNPLTPVAPPQGKSRYSDRAKTMAVEKAAKKTARVKEKVASASSPLTAEEQATAKMQAAPLGLSGDTGKKVKKTRAKGEAKERLSQQAPQPKAPMPDETPSKAMDRGTVYEGTAGAPKKPASSDATTLPALTAPSSATPPQGTTQPATPGNPIGTPPPQR